MPQTLRTRTSYENALLGGRVEHQRAVCALPEVEGSEDHLQELEGGGLPEQDQPGRVRADMAAGGGVLQHAASG